MKIAISGSRTIDEKRFVIDSIAKSPFGWKSNTFLVGDSSGVDEIFLEYASDRADIVVYEADWNNFGNSAGPIRNRLMIDDADALIAIWDGESKGTKDTIDKALRKPIETHVYLVDPETKSLMDF